MPEEIISNLYLNYGLFGLIVISFFVLLVWTIKKSEEREEKLHNLINTLSLELPEMKATLTRIENKMNCL